MKRFSIKSVSLASVFFLFFGCIHGEKAPNDLAPVVTWVPPKRVLVMVFDQMRFDLAARYGLKNFKWLENHAISYPNAYVGHLGSITIVSHAVMTAGVFPKKLPWRDDVMKDTEGLLGKKGAFYSTVDLEQEQYFKLLESAKTTSLVNQLKNAPVPMPSPSPDPGDPAPRWGNVYAIGQKYYAAMVYGGPSSDSIITLGPKRREDPLKGWRAPVGFQVPKYFLNPFGGRFFLDSSLAYGSENTLYPLDGNRFYPGSDKDHEGGDKWVSDGVKKILDEDPNWRGIFATFGSIDKVLHMLGEHETPTKENWANEKGITLKDVLERADSALGDVIQALREKDLLKDTVIVVTADHGGQVNTSFHGMNQPGLGTSYFEYGKGQNFDNTAVSPTLKPLVDTGLVDASTQDSMLRFWLKKRDKVSLIRFADKMRGLAGIGEIYTKQETSRGVHYIRTYRSSKLDGKALDWAKSHNQELVETMAAPGSPDVLGLLLDNNGYALIGEHGGAQEQVQRIPFYVMAPNLKQPGTKSDMAVRLVDLNPIVNRVMQLPLTAGLDGTSRPIDEFIMTEKAK